MDRGVKRLGLLAYASASSQHRLCRLPRRVRGANGNVGAELLQAGPTLPGNTHEIVLRRNRS